MSSLELPQIQMPAQPLYSTQKTNRNKNYFSPLDKESKLTPLTSPYPHLPRPPPHIYTTHTIHRLRTNLPARPSPQIPPPPFPFYTTNHHSNHLTRTKITTKPLIHPNTSLNPTNPHLNTNPTLSTSFTNTHPPPLPQPPLPTKPTTPKNTQKNTTYVPSPQLI